MTLPGESDDSPACRAAPRHRHRQAARCAPARRWTTDHQPVLRHGSVRPIAHHGAVATHDIGPPAAAAAPASPPVQLPTPDHRGRPVTARLRWSSGIDGSRVRIDLEPADLGRVEVALRLDDSGAAAASFTVDRPETLQLLQRDARVVERDAERRRLHGRPGRPGASACATPAAATGRRRRSRAAARPRRQPEPGDRCVRRRASAAAPSAACWICRSDMRAHRGTRRRSWRSAP